jgi:hypothetical protein
MEYLVVAQVLVEADPSRLQGLFGSVVLSLGFYGATREMSNAEDKY